MVLNIFSITFYTDIIYHPEVEFCRIKMYDHYRQEKKACIKKKVKVTLLRERKF